MDDAARLSDPSGTIEVMHDLSVKDHMTLQLEERWWKHPGAKDRRIRDTFGESATRYYQRLNALIDQPAALAAYPMTVRRLRRIRDDRRRLRSSEAVGYRSGK